MSSGIYIEDNLYPKDSRSGEAVEAVEAVG